MKDTIKNTVSEVYKPNNKNDYSFNKDLFDNNNNIAAKNIKNLINNDTVYVDKNTNKKTKYNNNGNNIFNNEMINNNNGFSFGLLFILIILISLIGVVIYFKDTIMNFFNNFLKQSTVQDSEDNELRDELDEIKKELSNERKKQEEKEKEDKEKKEKENKEKEGKKKKTNKKLLQQYSSSQIVKDDGYCYIGTDNNVRHCVNVYEGEICSSGDIYKRIDKCLVPELRT